MATRLRRFSAKSGSVEPGEKRREDPSKQRASNVEMSRTRLNICPPFLSFPLRTVKLNSRPFRRWRS